MREQIDRVKNFKQFVNENEQNNFSFKKDVNDFGRKLSKNYIVTINYQLPYISLANLEKTIWFSQGEEAQNLIDEIPSDIKPEYYLLWYLESAGVF